MSSIITNILSSTVGLLWNKARDTTADKLKDGDVTDAHIRKLVVREFNDIKSKLDGLSLKDLTSSYSFLKEGVDILCFCLDNPKNEQKAAVNEAQDGDGETSRMLSGVDPSNLNEASELPNLIAKLKIASNGQFEYAKSRFTEARTSATHAFSNKALTIQDRLMAAKLRIVATILESLDSPEIAITACVSFLKELHSLQPIREIFSVYLNRGVKSYLNKAERVENVKAVMLINQVLFQLNLKFSRNFTDRVSWPAGTIELDDRSFNPVIDWQEVSTRKSMGNDLMQPPNRLIHDKAEISSNFAVNSKGEIVVLFAGENKINVISGTKESKVVKLREREEDKDSIPLTAALAVDNNNNVYVVRLLQTLGDGRSYVLSELDENYNVKHHCALGFFDLTVIAPVKMAVNRNNDIMMIQLGNPHVYVCDNCGQLKRKFERGTASSVRSLSISDKNGIIVVSENSDGVNVYTEEGNLRSIIKVPEDHSVRCVGFHHVLGKMIVLTRNTKVDSFFLLCFSETSELETSMFFCKRTSGLYCPTITSHPSGPVAVFCGSSITFI